MWHWKLCFDHWDLHWYPLHALNSANKIKFFCSRKNRKFRPHNFTFDFHSKSEIFEKSWLFRKTSCGFVEIIWFETKNRNFMSIERLKYVTVFGFSGIVRLGLVQLALNVSHRVRTVILMLMDTRIVVLWHVVAKLWQKESCPPVWSHLNKIQAQHQIRCPPLRAVIGVPLSCGGGGAAKEVTTVNKRRREKRYTIKQWDPRSCRHRFSNPFSGGTEHRRDLIFF